MTHFIFIGVSILLFVGFLVLVVFEKQKGARVADGFRAKLDRKVSRASFIATHVDWGAFMRHLAGTVLERILHDIAHGVLQMVRATERSLTRAVKTLRERRGMSVVEAEQNAPLGRLARGIERVRSALRNSSKQTKSKE